MNADQTIKLEPIFKFSHGCRNTAEQYGYFTNKFPKHIIFFQVGMFFEFYAELPPEILEILKLRRLQRSSRHAWYGFPRHLEQAYMNKLLSHGYPVVLIQETSRTLGRLKERTPSYRIILQIKEKNEP